MTEKERQRKREARKSLAVTFNKKKQEKKIAILISDCQLMFPLVHACVEPGVSVTHIACWFSPSMCLSILLSPAALILSRFLQLSSMTAPALAPAGYWGFALQEQHGECAPRGVSDDKDHVHD